MSTITGVARATVHLHPGDRVRLRSWPLSRPVMGITIVDPGAVVERRDDPDGYELLMDVSYQHDHGGPNGEPIVTREFYAEVDSLEPTRAGAICACCP